MKIIYFISFLFLFCKAQAQVNNNAFIVKSTYCTDSNSEWTIKDLENHKFKSINQSNSINIGYNKQAAVWCKINIKNTNKTQAINAWLCFDNNHIDSLTLFDGELIKLLGDRTLGRSPFIETLAFEIRLKPNEERTLIVRVKKETSYLDFSYRIANGKNLEKESSYKIAKVAFFIGMIALLLIINGFLFINTKNKLYIYYVAYSLLTAFYVAITTNFAKYVLFPDFRFFSEFRIYTGALWYVALSYFLCFFLSLKEKQQFKYQIINLLNLINLFFVLSSICLLIFYPKFDFKSFFILGYSVFLINILLLFWASVAHLKIDKNVATYAILAFLPNLIWGAGIILKSFSIIPKSLDENWMVIIGLYEVFLFAYVLSRNYIEVFVKNNQLMQEAISEKESSLRVISEVQLRERRNIANIIHDNVGSKIAYIIHLFDLKDTSLARLTINELADDIRDISHQILPKALDEGALISSLQSQIGSLNKAIKNARIELFCYDFPNKIDEPWIFDIYLISLEIINNAIKHGKPKLITLEFYLYPECYLFQYNDDGIGFDLKQTNKGFGLENIEKRVQFFNGHFEIYSSKNQGTTIQINIPV